MVIVSLPTANGGVLVLAGASKPSQTRCSLWLWGTLAVLTFWHLAHTSCNQDSSESTVLHRVEREEEEEEEEEEEKEEEEEEDCTKDWKLSRFKGHCIVCPLLL